MIRLLTFTNLYPSEAAPRHGIFVEQRLRRLVETGRVQASVVVPVPHRPGTRGECRPEPPERHGIAVRYCRFPFIRGITTVMHPRLMARCVRGAVEQLREERGDFDLIDAHFLYPDGVGAIHLGRWLNRPVVLTARGSDVNVALRERIAGRSIRWAARRAAALIAVSSALRDSMIAQGLPAERITVVRNGVDLNLFKPGDRAALRNRFGFTGPTLLSVGNLVPEKGHELTLAALARLPDTRLVLIGSGPQEESLRKLADEHGVASRVTWMRPLPQSSLAEYYSAADLTVLSSLREGMPNVLLESLACGTRVVATAVGGAPEIVTDPVAGTLLHTRSADALAQVCAGLLAHPVPPCEVRRFAERFGWHEPVAAQLALFESILRRS
ncbi:MAG TPA: glycosyltransferase [Steroidobacteraceae bacterium]